LNLRLVCSAKTPALDVWPAFPLHIQDSDPKDEDLDNIIALLERSDRVHVIDLWRIPSSHWEKLSATMQVPFPELTKLELWSNGEAVLPDSVLGGSAPCLRYLWFNGIPFPGLPKLLLSTTYLVTLHLENIPHSGYISPEAMATALSALTHLDSLNLEFLSPQSRPDRESRPPHLPCHVLFALTFFRFRGDSEYLDDLAAHIDAPRLKKLCITFFNDVVFDTPQFTEFIGRTPTLKALDKARVIFDGGGAWVDFSSLKSGADLLNVRIPCRGLDWQVSSMEQVCTSCLPPLSNLRDLYIDEGTSSRADGQDNIDNSLWLELLHPFSVVKNLYLSEEFARRIVPALKELVESRATEVLPALEHIYLEELPPWGAGGVAGKLQAATMLEHPSGRVEEGIRQFVATRQVTSDPIAVSRWNGGRY
jgi:hypothetical protein